MLKKSFLAIFFAFNLFFAFGQKEDLELADTYYKLSEFEKAKELYQKINKAKDMANTIHKNYLSTLIRLKEYGEAEKFIKKQIKANEDIIVYKAELVEILATQNKNQDAAKQFDNLVKTYKSNEAAVIMLSDYFSQRDDLEKTTSILTEARNASGTPTKYALQLAKLYAQMGQKDKMLEEILAYGLYEGGIDVAKAMIQDYFKDDKDKAQFEKYIYKKIQEQPSESFYTDLLIWQLTQKKDFAKAFIQARALDRRVNGQGNKVFELAGMAFSNQDFKDAATMYEYITKTYPRTELYPYSRRLLINCREEIVKNTYPVNTQNIIDLINNYQQMFDELGQNHRTMEAMRNTSKLYAFYLNKLDSAQITLEKAIAIAGNDLSFIDKCKLDLGDLYLLKNEPWESTLLYSQVEKSQREEQLGHEAKLKNAKLSYYKGDFELAKETLDVLKKATTREISNDAMALSLLIQDNTGLDSVTTAMEDFAAVELLVFQNKNDSALLALNTMQQKHAGHSLADDVLLLRADIYLKTNQPQKALSDYENIIKNYQYEITADDATFKIAKLYDGPLADTSKAMQYYQQILVAFPGSIYGAESRKRFRQLRGDVF